MFEVPKVFPTPHEGDGGDSKWDMERCGLRMNVGVGGESYKLFGVLPLKPKHNIKSKVLFSLKFTRFKFNFFLEQPEQPEQPKLKST